MSKKDFVNNLNTAVFTTKYILNKNSPILYVYHYEEDGAWEFSGMETDINEDDYRVLSLEEIINSNDIDTIKSLIERKEMS